MIVRGIPRESRSSSGSYAVKKPGLDSGRAFLLHGSRTMTVSRGHQRAACVHALHAQPAEAQANLALGQVTVRAQPGRSQSRSACHAHSRVRTHVRPGLDPRSSCHAQRASARMSVVARALHCAPHSYPGGATNPWYSCSSNCANRMQVKSLYCGPTICTPTGSRSGVSPAGATVEGK
jgi:hypothetical protein